MEELKKNRWTFSEKYTCKKQFECLRREKLHVRGASKDFGIKNMMTIILHDRRKMTADTLLRLAKYFGVSDQYFLNVQNDIDIREQNT